MHAIQITRLPIDPITVGRQWGQQRHPQGASLGSNGRQLKSKSQTWPPPAIPYPLPASVCQGFPTLT
jgi:hypothetical protein